MLHRITRGLHSLLTIIVIFQWIPIERSLCALLQGLEGAEDWVGGEEEPLVGFSWRGGIERDTTGILMWSEPFIVTLFSGDEVCIAQHSHVEWQGHIWRGWRGALTRVYYTLSLLHVFPLSYV